MFHTGTLAPPRRDEPQAHGGPGSCRCPDPPLRGDLCYCEETTLLLRLLPRCSCPGLQGNYCASLRRNSFVPLPSGILYLVLLHTLFRFLVRGTDLGPRAEQGVPPVPRGSFWRCSSIWTSRLCSGCAAMVASAVPLGAAEAAGRGAQEAATSSSPVRASVAAQPPPSSGSPQDKEIHASFSFQVGVASPEASGLEQP